MIFFSRSSYDYIDLYQLHDLLDNMVKLEPSRLLRKRTSWKINNCPMQGFGKKDLTLYDIRSELFCRYKDLRPEYQ